MQSYDAIIVGAGQSGGPLAHRLADRRWKVALVEREYLGGGCINFACTPTKTMIASAAVAETVRRSREYGVESGPLQVHMGEVVERKNKIVQMYRQRQDDLVNNRPNITLIRAEAAFTGPHSLLAGENEITSDKIFIDTGSSPRILPIDGIDRVPYLTSRTILDLDVVPEHLIVLGGSYVGLEFGQMFARFGSRVTVVEHNGQITPKEDPDVASALQQALEKEGLRFITGAEASQARCLENGMLQITVRTQNDGSEEELTGSHLLMATGRDPNTQALSPQKAGIKVDRRGWIEVNEYLETNVPGIYAMGDVNGGPAFTHISYEDFLIVFHNLFHKDKRSTKDRLVPYALYTDPELGRVGLTETQARKQGLDFRAASIPISWAARAVERGKTEGLMKVVVDVKSEQILGAAILSAEGGELIHTLMALMLAKASWRTFYRATYIHPTLSEGFYSLFEQVEEKINSPDGSEG